MAESCSSPPSGCGPTKPPRPPAAFEGASGTANTLPSSSLRSRAESSGGVGSSTCLRWNSDSWSKASCSEANSGSRLSSASAAASGTSVPAAVAHGAYTTTRSIRRSVACRMLPCTSAPQRCRLASSRHFSKALGAASRTSCWMHCRTSSPACSAVGCSSLAAAARQLASCAGYTVHDGARCKPSRTVARSSFGNLAPLPFADP
mmetsp:Transcript_10315/g.35924  ORF Transcript_10315/g.35924 Transcript_10315/m.35924 type:complete len:204 (-) Transcript_10315:77-688(-)